MIIRVVYFTGSKGLGIEMIILSKRSLGFQDSKDFKTQRLSLQIGSKDQKDQKFKT